MLKFMELKFSSFRHFAIIACALAVFCSEAQAWEPYPRLPLNMVTVALTPAEAKSVFREAHKMYADIGINLSLVKTRVRKNSYDRGFEPGDDEDWSPRYLSIRAGWKNYFKTRAVKRAVNVALIPRMMFGDGPLQGGMASGICDLRRGVAFATAAIDDKRLRRDSAIVLAHEIGHLAGASHPDDTTISIMNASATFWADLLEINLDFDLDSAASIRACLRSHGYYQQNSPSQVLALSCTM